LISQEILKLENINFSVTRNNRLVNILDNISFTIFNGEIFGITGESGAGKTSLGKIICGLETPTSGKKFFEGKEFFSIAPNHKIQFLFQDYYSFHDPLQKINSAFNEILSLKKTKSETFKLKKEILNTVGLGDDVLQLYPKNLSGGQLQRLALAKLLLVNPTLLILDEPFSSQDLISISNLIKLILRLNQKLQNTFICISHDIPFLMKLCDRIMIMKEGKIEEIIKNDKITKTFESPTKDYTKFLFQAFDTKFNFNLNS